MATFGPFDAVAHGSGPVASSRSQPAKPNGKDSRFKNPPTAIGPPSQPPSRSRGGPYNPFAAITQDNLTPRQRSASGQRQPRPASTSVSANEPPTKKRKITQNPKSLARKGSLEEMIVSVGQSSMPQLANETIDVDASDEDPIEDFPSDDCRPVPPSEATPSRVHSNKKQFEDPGVASTVGTSASRSSGINAVLKAVEPSRVKSLVRSYEDLSNTADEEVTVKSGAPMDFASLKRYDFKQPVKKTTTMKKRGGDVEDRSLTAAGKQLGHASGSSQLPGENQAGPSTTKASSGPTHQLGKPPPKAREPRGLPFEFWYCGSERRNKEGGGTLWLENGYLVIKDHESEVVERINHESIHHIETGKGNPPLIIRLDPNSKDAARLDSEAYKPTAPGPTGEINFAFNRNQHDGWEANAFVRVVRGLQALDVRCDAVLEGAAGKARMGMAAQEADIVEKGGILDDYKRSDKVSTSDIVTSRFYNATSTKGGIKKPNPAAGRPIFNNETKTPRGKRARSSASPPPLLFPPATRRSARHSAPVPQSPSRPIVNPDEIILVYPPSGTGALNITNGDLARLNPDEFLNDTLIEFALKLWLNTLREQNPTLAEQVHVFNSFFYKKLAVKAHAEGYRSVKKWTSKFDLFQKKYVIVPINEHLHWYLAIIFNPGLVFASREAPPPPQTRNAKRKSSSSETISDHGSNEIPPRVFDAAIQSRMDLAESVTDSTDADQRDDVSMDQLSNHPNHRLEADDLEMVPDSDDDGERREVEDNIQSLSLEGSVRAPSREKTPALTYPPSPMDIDQTTPFKVEFVGDKDPGSPLSRYHLTLEPKERERSNIEPNEQEMANAVAESTSAATEQSESATSPKLEIFVFDSLGSKHPAAVSHLNKYLVSEAEDKKSKQLPLPEKVGRQVKAPRQPNHCDCGIYLLHFVETVMKDPETFLQLHTTKGFDGEHSFWDQPTLDNRRQSLHDKIVELSTDWKRAKGESVTLGKDSQAGAGPSKVVDDEANASQDVQLLGDASNDQHEVEESDEPVIVGESKAKRLIFRPRG